LAKNSSIIWAWFQSLTANTLTFLFLLLSLFLAHLFK
jgi:hypothetical protein